MKNEAKLEKFLRAHECYTEFLKGIKKDYQLTLKEYCDTINISQYISGGIDWRTSKKGLNFWIVLNKEWKNDIKTK